VGDAQADVVEPAEVVEGHLSGLVHAVIADGWCAGGWVISGPALMRALKAWSGVSRCRARWGRCRLSEVRKASSWT
jgi:hypothetical protein